MKKGKRQVNGGVDEKSRSLWFPECRRGRTRMSRLYCVLWGVTVVTEALVTIATATEEADLIGLRESGWRRRWRVSFDVRGFKQTFWFWSEFKFSAGVRGGFSVQLINIYLTRRSDAVFGCTKTSTNQVESQSQIQNDCEEHFTSLLLFCFPFSFFFSFWTSLLSVAACSQVEMFLTNRLIGRLCWDVEGQICVILFFIYQGGVLSVVKGSVHPNYLIIIII